MVQASKLVKVGQEESSMVFFSFLFFFLSPIISMKGGEGRVDLFR